MENTLVETPMPVLLAVLVLAQADLPRRDVLATAFDEPFVVSTTVLARYSHDHALVWAAPGMVVWKPGITSVTAQGETVPAQRLSPDALRLPGLMGPVEIRVDADSAAVPTSTPGEPIAGIQRRAGALGPGDVLTIADGRYEDIKLTIDARGTADEPIRIRPATPGGVTFTGSSRIDLTGAHLEFREFRFEHCLDSTALQLTDADSCQVTQCHFVQCGKPVSTLGHIVELGLGCDDCRVDHCYFSGSRSMSLAQRVTAGAANGRGNRFEANEFRDVFRYWINGQENIQLGQNQRGASGEVDIGAVVEGNLFDHAWGDSEVFSNKSSGNLFRLNVAAWCIRSAYTLRGGNGVRFADNTAIGCGNGLRIMGRRHAVLGNLFVDCQGAGILMEAGSAADDMQVATEETTIAYNRIEGCTPAIAGMAPTDDRPHLPARVRIEQNTFAGEGCVLDEAYLREVTATGNATAEPSRQPDGTLPAAFFPLQRPGGLAEGDDFFCPPVPPPPAIAPDAYRDQVLFERGDEVELIDAASDLSGGLDGPLVVGWEYHPASFASVARLRLGGYELEWGGAEEDGRPRGIIALRRAGGDALTLAADVLHHRLDFVHQGWLGRVNNPRAEPDAELWYRFTALLEGRRLILLLGDARRTGPGIPVLCWQDPRPAPEGDALRLEQVGAGRWRGVTVWRKRRLDGPPAAVGNLRAQAEAADHTVITWDAPRAGLTYQVSRRTGDAAWERLTGAAAGLHDAGYDDFDGAHGRGRRYSVVAVDEFGRSSPAAEVAGAEPPPDRRGWPRLLVDPARVPPAAGTGVDTPPDGPGLAWQVTIARDGDYAVWGEVVAPDDGSDSFWVALDGAWTKWYTGVWPARAWSCAMPKVHLAAGEHTIEVRSREPGCRLYGLLVADSSFRPAGRR